jgi:hypothetical protein
MAVFQLTEEREIIFFNYVSIEILLLLLNDRFIDSLKTELINKFFLAENNNLYKKVVYCNSCSNRISSLLCLF